MIGPLGAHLSGLLVLLFGAPAFLFPVMIGFAGWLLYQDRSKDDAPSRATLRSAPSASCSRSLTSCGLASLHFTIAQLSELGGRRARLDSSGSGLERGLSFLGATLLLLALWLAGVSLFAGVSWIEIMDRTGRATLNALDWLSGAHQRLRARSRRAARSRKRAAK